MKNNTNLFWQLVPEKACKMVFKWRDERNENWKLHWAFYRQKRRQGTESKSRLYRKRGLKVRILYSKIFLIELCKKSKSTLHLYMAPLFELWERSSQWVCHLPHLALEAIWWSSSSHQSFDTVWAIQTLLLKAAHTALFRNLFSLHEIVYQTRI